MKPLTVVLPLRLPKLSDAAAAQLIDLLQQLLDLLAHHYAPQLDRYRQRHSRRAYPKASSPTLFDNEPF